MSKERSLDWVEYTKIGREVSAGRERVVTELGLSIMVNGSHFTTATITPMMEKEFVIGHLFGEGIINDIADIESITIKDDKAEVTLHKNKANIKKLQKTPDFKIDKGDIFDGVNAILNSRIYAETKAVHSAGLFRRGAEPVCIVEDVGRHNALDKVIGYALSNNIDFSTTFATSTGRMVSDMVSKICRAGIPIVATKTAVTKLGVEIGEKYGLTIIGFVRDIGMKVTTDTADKISTERVMKIYTNPGRVIY
jgi:FdhD protein